MKAIDEETKAALAKLGMEEEQIAELTEKAKAVQEEPNVKIKETDEGLREKVVHWVAEALGVHKEDAVPEASGNITEVPATSNTETTPEATKATQPQQREILLDDEALTVVGQKAAESLAVKMAEALGPMIQPLQAEVEALKVRLIETEKSVEEKVQARIDELPPIVKVRPSLTAKEAPPTMVLPVGAQSDQPTTEAQKFLADVADLVKKGLGTNDLTKKVNI